LLNLFEAGKGKNDRELTRRTRIGREPQQLPAESKQKDHSSINLENGETIMRVASRFIIIFIFFAFGISLILGCNKAAPAPVLREKIVIDEIRGDKLGMTLSEYEKKHTGFCSSGICVSKETYAGAPATKEVDFTNGGHLWKIAYAVEEEFSQQLLQALKEKYGDPGPGCSNTKGTGCSWSNGKVTVNFLQMDKNASVVFTDIALSEQSSKEYDQEQEAKRKNDQ
jgi:hypothetical protein